MSPSLVHLVVTRGVLSARGALLYFSYTYLLLVPRIGTSYCTKRNTPVSHSFGSVVQVSTGMTLTPVIALLLLIDYALY